LRLMVDEGVEEKDVEDEVEVDEGVEENEPQEKRRNSILQKAETVDLPR